MKEVINNEFNEKKSNKGIWVIVGVVIIVLIIGVYFMYTLKQNTENYSASMEKVTFGVEVSMLPAVVWIAENKGYFEDEGLELTMKEFDSGRDSFIDMLDDGVDISMVAPTPPMYASFEREDFYFFSTFATSDENIKVIANTESGIETAKDLVGKKIGTPKGTTGDFFVDSFLIFNNIAISDVEVINVAPQNLPDALKNGEVDAIVIWEPHANKAKEILGNNAIQLESKNVYIDTFNFMVMKEYAERNPEVLKKFLRSIDKAVEFSNNNKEESQIIVADRIGVEKETVTKLWEEYEFKLSLDQSLILILEDEARWAIENDLTDATEIPNYLDYIYIDALEEINPEIVTIIS